MKKAAAIALALLSWGAAHAQPRTHVLFTVDVESFAHGDPAEQIWGEIAGHGEKWGITRIMDVFEAAGLRATFYLNVYEAAAYGVDSIRRAAVEIHRRDHDLQLHTHPAPMFGVPAMSDGNVARQEEILRKGVDLLHEWTGQTVIAHRAGGFRANLDTLRAARRAGLPVDSSFSPVSPDRYPIARHDRARNTVQVIAGVVQLPLTYYHQVALGNWGARRLVDLEASTEAEMRSILDQAANGGLCAVNILMHSFSLSRDGRPDAAILKRLEAVIAYAKGHAGLEVVTTTTLYERIIHRDVCAGETEVVPVTGWLLTAARAIEDFDRGWKNKALVLGGGGIVLLLFSGTVIAARRWRR